MSQNPATSRSVPIGTRLLLAIVRRGLSVTDAATHAGMPTSQLSRILTGQTDPKWSTVERICGSLLIPMEELTVPPEEAGAH